MTRREITLSGMTEKNMRILEINKFNFPKGGADKHFLDVVALLESAGHQTAVFSMKHSKNLPSRWEKYFVSTVGYTDEYSFWQKLKGILRMFCSWEANKKINKLLDDFAPDLVHIHNIYHQLSPLILFEIKKRGIPIVMTVHDYKLVSPNYNLYHNGKIYDRCRDGKYYQCFFDRCVKNSYAKSFAAMLEAYWHEFWGTYRKNIDLYICPSEFVANILIERGIDGEKIKVVPHFVLDGAEEKTEDGNRPPEKYALYFGRISKAKGVDTLIEVFENISGMKLYLAGSVEDSFKLSKNKKNIIYLGQLNQIMLRKYIGNAEMVVSGSRLPETFGLVALEAIAEGKPFVGFEAGAYGEIIENGVNGFLTKDKSEMVEVIEKIIRGEIFFDKEKIRSDASKKYDKNVYISQFENILYNLVKKGK